LLAKTLLAREAYPSPVDVIDKPRTVAAAALGDGELHAGTPALQLFGCRCSAVRKSSLLRNSESINLMCASHIYSLAEIFARKFQQNIEPMIIIDVYGPKFRTLIAKRACPRNA